MAKQFQVTFTTDDFTLDDIKAFVKTALGSATSVVRDLVVTEVTVAAARPAAKPRASE